MGTIQHDRHWDTWLHKWYIRLLLTGIVVNLTGLFDTILEPDGALYATIARTIQQSGDYINLKVEGRDWLDKPHFPFWLTALSFELFGINTFAYKFPALLFWAAGGYYTYRFARALQGRVVAKLSVLVYLTAAHLVISNNDVRAEPYLTGLTIGSVYHFYRAAQQKFSLHLVAGALLAGCAVMTKGPFILITIGAGFITGWIIKKEWQQFWHPRWWVAVLLVLVFIFPELYSLYLQFDLHPEKLVFNRTGVSGLRFFFYDSQFGRFFNSGPIKGKGDKLFYFHTLLWAFLPWALLLYVAFVYRIRKMQKQAFTAADYIPIGASGVTFLIFSLSRFQLPHYMNIVFPFFAILTAQYVSELQSKQTLRIWSGIQTGICLVLVLLMAVVTVLFRLPHTALPLTFIAVGAILAYYFFRGKEMPAVVGRSFVAAAVLYGFLNLFFYPALLQYQSGSQAAFFANRLPYNKPVCTLQESSYSFSFYLHQPVCIHKTAETLAAEARKENQLVFTRKENLDSLAKTGLQVTVLKAFPHYHISQIKGKFINHQTRKNVLDTLVIGKISLPENSR